MTTHSHKSHQAGAPPDVDWSEQAEHLVQAAGTDAQWYRAVAADLTRPGDRLLVDIGCGGAGMASALAAAAPDAEVVGVDDEAEVLAAARTRLDDIGASVRLVRADLTGDPGALAEAIGAPADLVWASAVVHHAPDQQAAIGTLVGLLSPRGRLALAEGGLAGRHLPWDVGIGEPGLELRLEAAQGRWFAAMRADLQGVVSMAYGWNQALEQADLVGVTTRTSLIEHPAPLPSEDQDRVVAALAHRVDWLRDADVLSHDDLAAWDRLLDPQGPEWLGHRDDVFVLEARSVHLGNRPG